MGEMVDALRVGTWKLLLLLGVGEAVIVGCSSTGDDRGAPVEGRNDVGEVAGGGASPVAPVGGGGGSEETPTIGEQEEPEVIEPLLVTDSTCGFGEFTATGPEIVVENLASGETIPHQMVRIVGRLSAEVDSVGLVHGETTAQVYPRESEFVAFAVLEPGLNYLGFEAEGHTPLCFPVSFEEPENDHEVRYFSFTASDSDPDKFLYIPGSTDPRKINNEYSCLDDEPCDARTIADRMRFMALIDQMLLAEILVAAGAPRETFTLARDENGDVLDPLFLSERTAEEHRADAAERADKPQGYFHVMYEARDEIRERELDEGLDPSLIKHVMIFRDVQSGAWGGGNYASFGGGHFYSWASNLEEFYERLQDERDTATAGPIVGADNGTVNRRFIGSMGTLLHEFGHTLGLPHPKTSQPCKAIMNHGFRHMEKYMYPGYDEAIACWTPGDGIDPQTDHEQRVLDNPWIKGVSE